MTQNIRTRKTAAPKAAAPRKTAAALTIDFPREGEAIRPGHYTVRIGAVADGPVEVSFGGKHWEPCRPSVGYYWFDWTPEKTGPVTLVARVRDAAGRPKRSAQRNCEVTEA